MKVGVPKEIAEGERRVALVPETVGRMVKDDYEVLVETGAGQDYNLDEDYEEVGAQIASDASEVYSEADIVVKIGAPTEDEVGYMHEGLILVCLLDGTTYPELVKQLADVGVTVFSNELVPRTGAAQSMDVLSSMGSIAGYKCAIIAADTLGKYVPTLSTAAGTTPAAKVIVLGAAVAGLQAVATMHRLGGEVFAYDIMPATKEQVHSVGGTFIDSADLEEDKEDEEPPLEEQEYEPAAWRKVMEFFGFYSFVRPPEPEEAPEAYEEEEEEEEEEGPFSEEKQEEDYKLVREHLRDTDIVITTAIVPGAPPPTLLTQDMVEEMQPGSVVVDLAGGNCELTQVGETVEHEHVSIIGPDNLPSQMPIHASQLYSRNMKSFIDHIVEDVSEEDAEEKDLQVNLDFEDNIIDTMCITHDGEIRHDDIREVLEGATEESEAQ
ncbi:MAG TPA: NAD(P) transhydrogenase subunit alpha [Rubrobacteraceae bacterium]|jgi:NAD(P) transhydrogenase subunit alpha|nr:NAD(P) transhydrogenase subunit alpha [Rubrobacteraceae bacterium]